MQLRDPVFSVERGSKCFAHLVHWYSRNDVRERGREERREEEKRGEERRESAAAAVTAVITCAHRELAL